MASFSKEERVAFDQLIEGFDDALVTSKLVRKYQTDQVMMARTGDVIWRPMPYIVPSFDGQDQTGNFQSPVQLSVPSTISFYKSVPWQMDQRELRDALQEQRLGMASRQRLASDINRSITDLVCNTGTVFIKNGAAASGFTDAALIDTALNRQGVPMEDRNWVVSSSDYNNMAGNLQVASRSFGNEISDKALRKAFVGELGNIQTYKADYLPRKTAAAGGAGITISTLAAGVNIYVPQATSTATTGQSGNVDNRFQRVTVSSTTNVAAGDAFTIAGIEEAHAITKQATGTLRSFRVISVDSATTMTISPPIITAANGEQAAVQYQNCVATSTSGTAAIVFQNTVVGFMNPFWCKDAIEILPGRLAIPTGAGAEVLRASTENGIEVVMSKQYDIKSGQILMRIDTLYGVVNLQPQMTGIEMFSQT